ncbi:MAG: SDR family oxidoreductase, partial [Planctomycetales bacterium]|nr:SDR family oxidoreductase [Planctomycetales bacterium]
RRLMVDREIRENLQAIRATGAKVEYHSLDVRDEQALSQLVSRLRDKYGKIDGVVHAAGVIEDKLLRDKTPESFDRVFNTKVDSAFALAQLLDPQSVRVFVLFASIASRYGNRGQADYAAANEVLSKLAAELDRRWPGRVLAVAWGPWAERGMVSHLEKHLVARGIALIPPHVGAKMLVDELSAGQKGESEVIIAGGAEHLVRPKSSGEGGARHEPKSVGT